MRRVVPKRSRMESSRSQLGGQGCPRDPKGSHMDTKTSRCCMGFNMSLYGIFVPPELQNPRVFIAGFYPDWTKYIILIIGQNQPFFVESNTFCRSDLYLHSDIELHIIDTRKFVFRSFRKTCHVYCLHHMKEYVRELNFYIP